MKGFWACLFAGLELVASAGLRVTFPAERQKLPAVDQTYLIGALEANDAETVYVNGTPSSVYRTGAFLQMVPVKPGSNTVVVAAGKDRLVRHFFVASPAPAATPAAPVVVDSDDSPRLAKPSAWKTTGTLFTNRVRNTIDGGETLFYLPRGFTLRGAEVKGTSWVCVWLEDQRGFLPKSAVTAAAGAPLPPKGLMAPDPTAGFAEHPPYGRTPSAVRVCLDPGHGGSDSGTLSPHGWREKDVNLMQARAIRDALEKAHFQVVMTRDGDSCPSLYSRPQLAYDERVDAFISVHHNATAPQRDPRVARHTTTYASTSNGLALATCIQKHVGGVLAPIKDAGAQLKSYAVCRNPAVPSCLIEVDFINCPEGEAESWDPERQKKVAEAVVMGLLDWMTPPPEPASEPAAAAPADGE